MTNPLTSLTSLASPLTKGLMITVGVLSLTSVGEGFALYKVIESKGAVVQAVKDSNAQATHTAAVVAVRDNINVQDTQGDVSSRIASDLGELRASYPKSNLPDTSRPSGGTATVTAPPVVLPNEPLPVIAITLSDEEDCVVAIDVAEGWQSFYNNLLTIRKEEDGESADTSNPSSSSSTPEVRSPGIGESGPVRS